MDSSESKPVADLVILIASIVAILILFAIIRCSLAGDKNSTGTPIPTQINFTIIQLGSPQPSTGKVPLLKAQEEPSSGINMYAPSNNYIAATSSAADTLFSAMMSGDLISKITCWVLFVLLLLWIALNAFSSAANNLVGYLREKLRLNL